MSENKLFVIVIVIVIVKRQNGAQILMFVYISFPQVFFYCHIGWIMVELHCCRWLLFLVACRTLGLMNQGLSNVSGLLRESGFMQFLALVWFKHVLFRRKGLCAAYNETISSPDSWPYNIE